MASSSFATMAKDVWQLGDIETGERVEIRRT